MRPLAPHPARPVPASRRPVTALLLVPALLLVAALLGACGGGKSSGTTATGASRSPGASAGASSTGSPVPDASDTGGTSGGGGTGSGIGKRDACKVLTGQDAQGILGQPVGAGKDGSSLGIPYPSCTYTATSSSSQTVGLTIFDAAATANLINQYKQQFPDVASLPGVGDAAVSEGDGRLVVATKGSVGCVMLRAGDVTGSAASSTQLMAAVCKKVFASG